MHRPAAAGMEGPSREVPPAPAQAGADHAPVRARFVASSAGGVWGADVVRLRGRHGFMLRHSWR